MPFLPFHFALLLAALGLRAVFVQVGALTLAFDKLGLSSDSATLLLSTSLLGSLLRLPPMGFTGKTVVAINVGGWLVPLAFSIHLLRYHSLNLLMVISAVAMVAGVCRLASRPVPILLSHSFGVFTSGI